MKSMLECADLGNIRSANFDKICLKASRLSALLSRAYVSRDKAALMKLFNTHVRPIVEYAAPIWNPTEQGLTAQLERVQRRFTRMLFVQRTLNCEARLKELEIMSLAARRDCLDLIMTYKLLHGLVDTDVNKLNIVINSYNTWGDGTNIAVNRLGTAYVEKSFTY